jgi:hypothetical protein
MVQTGELDDVMIKIDFTINGFADALHLAGNHGLTDAEIEAMKQARYDKWREFVDNPPPVVDEPASEPVEE